LTGLKNGEILRTEPIVCVDFSSLLGELPEIEIGGLDKEAAFEVLRSFVKDANARIPDKFTVRNFQDPDYRKFFSRRSSGDPLPSYRKRIVDKAIPVIEEIAERDPGSDFELEVLEYATSTIGNGMMSSHTINQLCRKRLFENQIDNPAAQKLLIRLTSSAHSMPAGKHWRDLFEATKFEETKLVASYRLVVSYLQQAISSCSTRIDEKQFEESVRDLEQFAIIASENDFESEVADATRAQWKRQIANQVRYSSRRVSPNPNWGSRSTFQVFRKEQPSPRNEIVNEAANYRLSHLKFGSENASII
jgi:hypothetical protein